MSSCGNCDCADKTQCVKKGNSYGVEIVQMTETSYALEAVDVALVAEHDGKCKCGAGCTCVTCTCGH
ncbi:cystathionine beta-lyase [Asimina triloba]